MLTNPIQILGYNVIAYQDLSNAESEIVLNARNHSEVRNQMAGTNIITYEEHTSFISNLPGSNKYYYAVFKDESFWGSIYIHKTTNEPSEWGFYLSPEHIGSGKGVVLETIALELFFLILNCNSIIGYVKKSNENTTTLHHHFGFTVNNHSEIYNIISMQRTYWLNNRNKFINMSNSLSKRK